MASPTTLEFVTELMTLSEWPATAWIIGWVRIG